MDLRSFRGARMIAARPVVGSGLPVNRAVLPSESSSLAGARSEEEIAGPGGLLGQLTKRLIEGSGTPSLGSIRGAVPG